MKAGQGLKSSLATQKHRKKKACLHWLFVNKFNSIQKELDILKSVCILQDSGFKLQILSPTKNSTRVTGLTDLKIYYFLPDVC